MGSSPNHLTVLSSEWPVWGSRPVSPQEKKLQTAFGSLGAAGDRDAGMSTPQSVLHVTDDGWTMKLDSGQHPGLQSRTPNRVENIQQHNGLLLPGGTPTTDRHVGLPNQWMSQPPKNEPQLRFSDDQLAHASSPPRIPPASATPRPSQIANYGLPGQFEPAIPVPKNAVQWNNLRGMPVEDEQAGHRAGIPMPAPFPQPQGPYNLYPAEYPGYFLIPPPEPFTDFSFGFDAYRPQPGAHFLPAAPPHHTHPNSVNMPFANHPAPLQTSPMPDMRHNHIPSFSVPYEFPAPMPPATFFFPPPLPVLPQQLPIRPMGGGSFNYNFDRQRRDVPQNNNIVPFSTSPRRLPFSRSPQMKQSYDVPSSPAHPAPNGTIRGARHASNLLGSPGTPRSSFLEDFRSNREKLWKLKDLLGHIVEFSSDQHGSRFIQQQLEEASPEERQLVFEEIVPKKTEQLIQDVFGNYVIQKFFELGTPEQKDLLAKAVENKVVAFSLQIYGCRVVQKAIDCINEAQQTSIILSLEQHILTCIKDAHGNHVIQKLVEVVQPDRLTFLRTISENIRDLSTHPYGCRVLQRCLEHLPQTHTRSLLDSIHNYTLDLMRDQYGNYVIQFILEQGREHDKAVVISRIRGNLIELAQHKYASNVCEKALTCTESETRQLLIDEIMTPGVDGQSPIVLMVKDQYANYVLQRALAVVEGEQRVLFFNQVKPLLAGLRKSTTTYNRPLVSTYRANSYLAPHNLNHSPTHSISLLPGIISRKMEAAATLFGSDEPGSDPFATLGTEAGSSSSPANDLFLRGSNSSFILADTDAHNLTSQAAPAAHDTPFPGYPTNVGVQTTAVPDTIPYDYHQNTSSEQNQWDGGGHDRSLASSYLTPAYQTVTPPAPTTNYSTNYAPAPQAAPSTHPQYNPYDPSQPVATPHYSPATPLNGVPHQAHDIRKPPPPPPSSSQYAPPVSHYTAPAVSAPPIPTPKVTAITRPKVSNAYDPPFLPSKPNRRTARAASAHQTYSSYQPSPVNSYPPPPEQSLAYSGSYYQHPPPTHGPYSHDSTTAPSGSYQAHPNTYSPPKTYTATNSYAQTQTYTPSSTYVPPASTSTPYVRDNDVAGSAAHANYSPDRAEVPTPSALSVHSIETRNLATENTQHSVGFASQISDPYDVGPSRPARSSSISSTSTLTRESSQHMAEAEESAVLSPSMVPLPYSPPLQKEELQPYGPSSITRADSSTQPTPRQSSYIPPRKDSIVNKDTHDPYLPKINQPSNNYIPRTSSPLSVHSRPNEQKKSPPHAPPSLNGNVPRPLAPSSLSLSTSKTLSNYAVDNVSNRSTFHKSEGRLGVQELIVKTTNMQYAPSPSLIGANDPLSRTSARAPVVTFGFGGKMVTCFHGMPGLNAGFDVALSARTSSEMKIHRLNKVLPESALSSPGPAYPGPLLSDPGTPSLSLVRPGASAQTKTKKAGVVGYLTGRTDEINQGLGYLGPAEKQAAENKLILINLLKVMVENDGRLLGTVQGETAIRSVLVPSLEGSALQDGASLATYKSTPFDEVPLSVVNVRSSTLDKIEELLLQGDRRQAYQFAMDEKLWAHAMVIASSIDKEAWKEVVNEFLRSELSAKDDGNRHLASHSPHAPKSSRQSLRVAYSLFSGQGAAAEGHRTVTASYSLRSLSYSSNTQLCGNTTLSPTIPPEALDKWAETVAMMISSPLTPETSSALTALGDQLLANNWVDAAHACYLLSPQTSLIGGFGAPAVRLALVGSKTSADAARNPDTLVFSEILEFALSLVPTAKGQETFHGLPHLQTYRFIQAILLAEIGDIQLANRYCEAITTSLAYPSPYATQALLEQLHGLQERLSGVFHGDKNASWIGGKISKPSLDSIGGWLEGRFTKLVTGDSDSADSPSGQAKVSDRTFNGPFAHYSTISTTPSARSSPQPPPATVNYFPPPQRTTSAMATSSPYSHAPVERSSSAMDYMRQKPPVPSTSTSSVPSSESSPTGYGLNNYARDADPYAPKSHSAGNEELETPVQAASWWGADDAAGRTPTAATFMKIEESSIQASSDGFISLMDTQTFSFSSQQPSRQASSTSRQEEVEDDDDLGLGNSKSIPHKEESKEDTSPVIEKAAEPPKATPAAPAAAVSNGGGSWFGRWWKKSENTPGPVKASLGEESSFYYDKELKRWVNKAAGAEANSKPAAPPPPPSRAQTASPGMTHTRSTPPPPPPPPMRPASAIDLTTEPPTKVAMRIRSNLAPPTESAPSTPTGTRLNLPSGPPPPSRPRSQATKRPVRSRYVDVFQQEGGTSS
ncbi:hypothetical protein NLJ89_g6061 [Agrocybe chaxingu]|uniref:Protein transport protein sec16 n=1 Tax=Agrocybe chaxingu TaxID=84603 RepID=A0A9W8JZD3_9AGAR|nr:hypothetical protein NLJ89_g6061 [Agrocybe chaxingu]